MPYLPTILQDRLARKLPPSKMLSTRFVQFLAVTCVLASPHAFNAAVAAGIGGAVRYNKVRPMGTKNSGDDLGQLYAKFQPTLTIKTGCADYAAVDEDGRAE